MESVADSFRDYRSAPYRGLDSAREKLDVASAFDHKNNQIIFRVRVRVLGAQDDYDGLCYFCLSADALFGQLRLVLRCLFAQRCHDRVQVYWLGAGDGELISHDFLSV